VFSAKKLTKTNKIEVITLKNEAILFVEDDKEYRETLQNILLDEGYNVDAVDSALEAIELFTLNDYDLVISDLMMESIDGIRFLKYIKKVNPTMKTMIITADPTAETEIEALDIAVDKYIIKGMHFDVLIKHIEHLLKIIPANSVTTKRKIHYTPEKICLNLATRTVTKNTELINITTREFDVIHVLLSNRGTAMKREEIVAQIWDEQHEAIDVRVIDVHIRSIRKKLKTQAILSIRGYGYKWDL
jgi:Response regulators consisting of a CheY-like receiver domain and a winged-helix DNA-binding domain